MKISFLFLSSLLLLAASAFAAEPARHTFSLGERDFLLDDKPFQIISGELHPARIPREYWRHRIQMTKALGCNTIAAYRQDYGFILYKTRLIGHKSGKLTITDLHDYATLFLNGKYLGKIDRREGEQNLEISKSDQAFPVLEIFVEGMGRINFAQAMIDRKGITDRVTLNGMTLMNWEIYNLPFDAGFLKQLKAASVAEGRRGIFFRGAFDLAEIADTYIDMTPYKKGLVWVNGHNLGRYWEIGPQKRLYCPGLWLNKGKNEILIFDLHQTEPQPVQGMKTLE